MFSKFKFFGVTYLSIVYGFFFAVGNGMASESWQRLPVKQTRRAECCKGARPFVCIRPQDELWVVSARNAGCDPGGKRGLSCLKFVGGKFCTSNLQSLYSAHQNHRSLQTVLFVHGNRTDADWATSRGGQVYENVFAGCKSGPPIRYVIWQWRSEPELKRPIKDYTIKSRRAVTWDLPWRDFYGTLAIAI